MLFPRSFMISSCILWEKKGNLLMQFENPASWYYAVDKIDRLRASLYNRSLQWCHHVDAIPFFMSLTSVNISAHRQQFHTTYIFSMVIISSFWPEKHHMREALLFFLNLKKSAAESNACGSLWWVFYQKQRAEIGFVSSKTAILTWTTRSMEIDPRRFRTINCSLFWTKTIPSHKKCLLSSWVLLNQALSCVYVLWKRFPPQRTIAQVKNGPKPLGDTQMGDATPCRLFLRPGPFRLSTLFVDGPHARWAPFRFLRWHPKMAWCVVCLEREGIPLAWYPIIAQEIEKMCC